MAAVRFCPRYEARRRATSLTRSTFASKLGPSRRWEGKGSGSSPRLRADGVGGETAQLPLQPRHGQGPLRGLAPAQLLGGLIWFTRSLSISLIEDVH